MLDDETSQLMTLSEIAKVTLKSKSSLSKRASKEGWLYSEKTVRGKLLRLYDPKHLPPDIRFLLIIDKDINTAMARSLPFVEVSHYQSLPDFEEGFSDGWVSSLFYEPIETQLHSDGYCLGFGFGRWSSNAQWEGENAYLTRVLSCPYEKHWPIGIYLRGWWLKGYRKAMTRIMAITMGRAA